MSLLFATLYAAATTTTVEPDVPRIVGNPLSWPVFIGAGVALFAFILIGGLVVRRRGEAPARRR
jgi:hypothetical protein